MATATTLEEAAGQSFTNLVALWTPGGNVFRDAIAAFAADLLPLFEDQNTVGRPIANWLTTIAAIAFQMPSVIAPAQVDYGQFFVTANDYVYRMCWLAARPSPLSPAITNAQQTAILAAYNARF